MWATKHTQTLLGKSKHFFARKRLPSSRLPAAHAHAVFFRELGYKLSAQKMSNADTVKVDGRKGLSVRGANGFAKLAVYLLSNIVVD